jgi:hypothetical protein
LLLLSKSVCFLESISNFMMEVYFFSEDFQVMILNLILFATC